MPDTEPSASDGQYFGAITLATYTIGGYSAAGTGGFVRVENLGFLSRFTILQPMTGPAIAGYEPGQSGVNFWIELQGALLPTDAIPTAVDASFMAASDRLRLLFQPVGAAAGIGNATIEADITAVSSSRTSAVPEPGSVSLLAAGLLGLGMRGRAKRRRTV